jgi:hypothetical protein
MKNIVRYIGFKIEKQDGSSAYVVRNIWRDDVLDAVELSELVLVFCSAMMVLRII